MCKIKAREFADAEYEIPEKSLTVFAPGNKNFQLINENEILANGKLYDIVKKETRDKKTIFYALADGDEDEYTRDLTNLEKGNSQERSFPGKTIVIHIAKYFSSTKYNDEALSHGEILEDKNKFARNISLYKSLTKNVISPPPDQFHG